MRDHGADVCRLAHEAEAARDCLAIIFFFFNDTATTEIYTLSLHDALPIYEKHHIHITPCCIDSLHCKHSRNSRSEEHTSELQSRPHLVCRLLLEKKKKT